MTPQTVAVLAVLFCALAPEQHGFRGALAQDVEVSDEAPEVQAAEAPKEKAAPEVPGEPKPQDEAPQAQDEAAEGAPPAAPVNFAESAKELQEKLAQLKGLLDKRGGAVDPALKERLDGLTKQLAGLGFAGAAADGAMSRAGNKEADKFIANCITMSLKRAGMRRPSTLGALRRLASGKLTVEEATGMEFVRLVAVCITGLSDAELKQFNDGKLDKLPKALADKAASSEGKKEVLNLEKELPGAWEMLARVAAPLYDSVSGASGAGQRPPVLYGLLAGIPALLMVGFLAKKFLDMQKGKNEKEERKKEKAAKKKN